MEVAQSKIIPMNNIFCKCGAPVLIRTFKDGRKNSLGVCKNCLSDRMKNRKKRKPRGEKKTLSNPIDINNKIKIEIDFTDFKDIYDKICKKAQTELRTTEAQIIYYLKTV